MNTRSLALAALLPLAASADPSLTIYNQNFAVVRDVVPLDLKAGANSARFTETTAHLEPDSVILRDPKSVVNLHILEQNYRADPVSAGLLLSLHEGKEIELLVREPNKPDRVVKGKIIRSGYVPHSQAAMQRYGQEYYQNQMAMAYGNTGVAQPIVEVEGQLRFSLPGEPLFPALGDDTILKPTIEWRLHAEAAAKLDADLCYVTSGMSWEASYNAVAPEKGDTLDLIGWVTMDNQSGKTFRDARIQLMAGDVAKRRRGDEIRRLYANTDEPASAARSAPQVTEKSFDEYHLYTLPLATTLHDRETKQVEFVRATGVKAERIFVYDGVKIDANRWRSENLENIRGSDEYGTQSNSKVWVMREIKNSEANHLGIPLPRGGVRFYRQDDAGRLQFVGENAIDHTPKDERLRLYTGNAFDLVGERRRTTFKRDSSNHWMDESFELKLRNHKKETAEIQVVEHLYRWTNWEIRESSNTFLKTDAQTIEFRIPLKVDEERAVSYTVHYSW